MDVLMREVVQKPPYHVLAMRSLNLMKELNLKLIEKNVMALALSSWGYFPFKQRYCRNPVVYLSYFAYYQFLEEPLFTYAVIK